MLQKYIIFCASFNYVFWNGTRLIFVPSSFLLAGSCSTARSTSAEKTEMSDYDTVLCLAKMTQHSSTADWIKFYWRHRIGSDRTRTEQIFTFKVVLFIMQFFLQTLWHCQSQFNYCTCRIFGWFFQTYLSYQYSNFKNYIKTMRTKSEYSIVPKRLFPNLDQYNGFAPDQYVPIFMTALTRIDRSTLRINYMKSYIENLGKPHVLITCKVHKNITICVSSV